jgi:hypothetical protein
MRILLRLFRGAVHQRIVRFTLLMSTLVASQLILSCEILATSRECADYTMRFSDATTGERITSAEVTVALTNNLGGRSAEEYLALFGEPLGTTDANDGTLALPMCGRVGVADPVSMGFWPDSTLAVFGIQRTPLSSVEVALVEFRDPGLSPTGGANLQVVSVSSDSILVD